MEHESQEPVVGSKDPGSKIPLPGESLPSRIVIQNHIGSPWMRWFSGLGWVAFFLCFFGLMAMVGMNSQYGDGGGSGVAEVYHSGSKTADSKIALIRAEGALMSSDGFISKQIQRARKDKQVKAVVLRVDSPGGSVSASDNLYHQLVTLREERGIPIVVSMGGMAASGGYYISMAVGDRADSLYAEPTTTTGSIGVIIPHYNVSQLMKKYQIENDSIVSHPRKQMLSATKEPSREDREILQKYVNESFNRFKEIIRAGRPAFRDDPESLDVLATGEIFSGPQAEKNGLIDKIGYLEDAIAAAATFAGTDAESVRVVEYAGPVGVLDIVGLGQLAGTDSKAQEYHRIENLLQNLAVPRAYYLFSASVVLATSAE